MDIQAPSSPFLLQTMLQWITLHVCHFAQVCECLSDIFLKVELLNRRVSAFVILTVVKGPEVLGVPQLVSSLSPALYVET